MTAHPRHFDIQDDQVRRFAPMRFNRLVTVPDRNDVMARTRQKLGHHPEHMPVVIGNQDSSAG